MPRGPAKDCCGYDWRGFYIGGHVGLSNVEVDRDVVNSTFWVTPAGTNSFEQDANGRLILGGQIGYNFASGPWVFGVEATLADLYKNENVQSRFFPASDRWRVDINGLTTVTARLGYAFDKTLFLSRAAMRARKSNQLWPIRLRMSSECARLGSNGQQCHAGNSEWHNGWTVGTGIELSVHRNAIVGSEYNYIDLGSENSITLTSPAASSIFLNQDVDVQIHSFMGRVSYKFH